MVSEVIKAVVQSTASTINYIHWSIDTAVQKDIYIYIDIMMVEETWR